MPLKTMNQWQGLKNLEELGNAIKQFEESEEKPDLLGFLETITLDQASDEDRELPQGKSL